MRFAALVGVAPYDDKRQAFRPPFIRCGCKAAQPLFLPLVGLLTRSNPVLKAYYDRLIAQRRSPKVALIAFMRKFSVVLNPMITLARNGTPTSSLSS